MELCWCVKLLLNKLTFRNLFAAAVLVNVTGISVRSLLLFKIALVVRWRIRCTAPVVCTLASAFLDRFHSGPYITWATIKLPLTTPLRSGSSVAASFPTWEPRSTGTVPSRPTTAIIPWRALAALWTRFKVPLVVSSFNVGIVVAARRTRTALRARLSTSGSRGCSVVATR